MDRAPGQKRPDEEDKEAARILMTGKGRRRKQAKKQFYQKVWFQAVGLLLALGVVGTLLYLVFKPPSADKLYRQAEKLMKAGKEEAAYDGPIHEYIYVRQYDRQPGPQTEQIRAWADAIDVKRCEEKLQTLRQRNREKKRYLPQEGAGEDKPFEATLAEDEGKLDRARKLWQETKEGGSRRWELVADNHLRMLDVIEKQDNVFEKPYAAMGKSGEEPALKAIPQQAFLAWRAWHFDDRLRARKLFNDLKKETEEKTTADPGLYPWYLYAAWKGRQLEDSLDESPQTETHRKEQIQKQLKKAQNDKQTNKVSDALLICLDILALYEKKDKKDEKEEDIQALVKEARKLHDEILKK
jgi:hypothetical protein